MDAVRDIRPAVASKRRSRRPRAMPAIRPLRAFEKLRLPCRITRQLPIRSGGTAPRSAVPNPAFAAAAGSSSVALRKKRLNIGGGSLWSNDRDVHSWPIAHIADPARLGRSGKQKGRDSRHALCGLLQRSGRDNPQISGLRWSPPVRIRRTRTRGRAQQRISEATTGSTCLGIENLPRSGARKRIQ